jgi:hypothetical protein
MVMAITIINGLILTGIFCLCCWFLCYLSSLRGSRSLANEAISSMLIILYYNGALSAILEADCFAPLRCARNDGRFSSLRGSRSLANKAISSMLIILYNNGTLSATL